MSSVSKIPLLVTHDGSVDEFASIALLCGEDFQTHYDLKGVVVINGDTLGVPAYWCTKRILHMCGRPDIPVELSNARAANGFPWAYRQFPLILNTLPALPEIDEQPQVCPDNNILLRSIVEDADDGALVVLNLGGLTPFAQVLGDLNLWHKIKAMYWMAGAFDTVVGGEQVPAVGNIDAGIVPGAPMHSEWNVFFDPDAVKQVYDNLHPAEIYQFPLNVTNAYPNSAQWIRQEMNPHARDSRVIDFLANAYAAVVPQGGASLWDIVTTIGLMNEFQHEDKKFFSYNTRDIVVETNYGPNEGRLIDAKNGGGRKLFVAEPFLGNEVNANGKDKTSLNKLHNEAIDRVKNYAICQWRSIPNIK